MRGHKFIEVILDGAGVRSAVDNNPEEARYRANLALSLGLQGRYQESFETYTTVVKPAEAFWNAGWEVRQIDRTVDDLKTASRGVDVILNGCNPPYDRWAECGIGSQAIRLGT